MTRRYQMFDNWGRWDYTEVDISKDVYMMSTAQMISPVEFATALSDSTRQEIMQLTCCEWMNVGEIVEAVGVSQPTVSHHLAILKEAGLVDVETKGKHTYYTLNQECIVSCCGVLMQTFAPETGAAKAVQLSIKNS